MRQNKFFLIARAKLRLKDRSKFGSFLLLFCHQYEPGPDRDGRGPELEGLRSDWTKLIEVIAKRFRPHQPNTRLSDYLVGDFR